MLGPVRRARFYGDVTVGHVADLVAMVGDDDPRLVDEEVHHLYEWHHDRGVTGIQLAFTTVVVAALGAVAADATTAAIIAAVAIGLVAGVYAMWQIKNLNYLQVEYVAALRLGRRLSARRAALCLSAEANPGVAGFRDIRLFEYAEEPERLDRLFSA